MQRPFREREKEKNGSFETGDPGGISDRKARRDLSLPPLLALYSLSADMKHKTTTPKFGPEIPETFGSEGLEGPFGPEVPENHLDLEGLEGLEGFQTRGPGWLSEGFWTGRPRGPEGPEGLRVYEQLLHSVKKEESALQKGS